MELGDTAESVAPYFKPGYPVECRFCGKGFEGSWFSGIIIRCHSSDEDRYLVELHNLIADEKSCKPLREEFWWSQLRPLPLPETHREFKSGDMVEAFHNDGWWEGRVTEELGNGSFGVYFTYSEDNMVFPKDHLRIQRDWIGNSWLLPISESTYHKASGRGKGKEGKLVTKKRHRKSRRNSEDDRDRISDLPDNVLLHIMKFMDTKCAVQTCVLSKRWKDLCKRLTNLTFHPRAKRKVENFTEFVTWVLSSRDDSYSLLNLHIQCWTDPEVLDKVMKYAVFHDVQQLKIHTDSCFSANIEALPLIFCCQSLTSLQLSMGRKSKDIALPKSLQLPALKSLRLDHLKFTASDNDNCAEPFSNCHVLDTLVLIDCSLHNDAKVLHISNSTLSSLTICSLYSGEVYEIVLSTLNLSSFTVRGFAGHQLSSNCNPSHVGEVNIDMFRGPSSIVMSLLQVLSSVKILTVSSGTLEAILADLLYPTSTSMRSQPPCFVRLESLKVKRQLFTVLSDAEVNSVVEYLLQNSPVARVDVIKDSG